MDPYVKNILTEWNFTEYINAFTEQEISQESFECLDDDTIKLLFSKAGPRAIFKKKWSALKELNPIGDNSQIQVLENIVDNHQVSLMDISSEVVEEQMMHEDVVVESNSNQFQIIDNADISLKLCNPITDLIECLRNSPMGASILNFYRDNHMLPQNYRLMLCDIMLDVELRSNSEIQVSPARLKELSELIVEVFPTEQAQTYYVPYEHDEITDKTVKAKGKLYVRYCHMRGILRESRLVVSSRGIKRKLPQKSAVYLGFYDNFDGQESSNQIDQQIDDLQDNIDEWPMIQKYWKNTSVIRLKRLVEDKDTTSSDYINSFPILQHAKKALILINIDFEVQYPNKVDELKKELNSFINEIYNWCKAKKRLDKDLKGLFSELEKVINQDNEEIKEIICFMILPLMLPCPPTIYSRNKVPYRPKKLDVQKEFLFHAEDEHELKTYLKVRKDFCKSNGLTEQPLSVIVGETLQSIHTYYLIINDNKYEASSLQEAIDLNFKSFYAFQLAYSKIALFPWLVLQERIYKIRGDTDEVRPPITTFLTSLRTSV